MNTFLKKIHLLLFIGLVFSNLSLWGGLDHEHRVYVHPDQIVVTDDGIMFYDTDCEIFLKKCTLSYDEKGLFLIDPDLNRGPCGLHYKWCRYCGGCGVIYCPMKCECPNGVGG